MSTQAIQRPPNAQKKDIRALLQSEAVKTQIALVLPKHLTPDRMARVALTAILKTPKLADCKPESLLQALMLCSQAGLEPDGRNAHLIPYGDQVQVIFDYKGLVALAERNGVECIYADKVCQNDEFDAWVEEGEKKLKHRVNWKSSRGEAYAYYASCRRNGRLDYEVMTKDEVDTIRKRSRASGNGPWVTDYDEMAKKTVLRRMSKRWDLSSEVAEFITADDDVPANIPQAKRPEFTGDPFAMALPESTEPPPPPPPQKPAEQKPAEKIPPVAEKSQEQPVAKQEPAKAESDDSDLGPQKAPEQAIAAPAIPDNVIALANAVAGFRRNEGEDDAAAYARLVDGVVNLCSASSVTETQLLKFAYDNKLAKSGQKLNELAGSKLVGFAKAWVNILPEVRKL